MCNFSVIHSSRILRSCALHFLFLYSARIVFLRITANKNVNQYYIIIAEYYAINRLS